MANFQFGNFSAALAETEQQATGISSGDNSSPKTGVSFESKACNWGTAEEASAVVEAINGCPHLEHLNLEGNTLGVAAAQAIGAALERHPEMKRALWKDLFTGRLKTEIPQALESMGRGMIAAGVQLSVLDCSDNALGPNGMKGLVELLKSPTCYSLQELKLNNCGLGIQGATMLAQSLTHCLQSATAANPARPFQLRCFIAGRNRLENEGARALAAVFGRLGTLEELAVPQNGINHEGITALANALRQNRSLRVLNLNDNTITARGARGLAAALGSLQQLRELNLGDCLLRNAGAELLGEALADGHRELRVVNLGYNEIGPNGGMSVTGAMQSKQQLETLILNGNRFGQEYREYISEMLAECDRLHVLGELDEDDSDNESCDGDATEEGTAKKDAGDYGGEGDGEDDDDYEDVDEDEEDYDDDDDDEDDDDEDDEDGRRYGESDSEEAETEADGCDMSAFIVNQTLEQSRGGGSGGGSASKSRTLDTSAVNFSFSLNSTSGGAGAGAATAAANASATSGSAFFNGTDTSIVHGDTAVETFCLTAHPTVALFADIADDDKVAAFRTYLASLGDADYLLYVCFAVLKTSAISRLCPAALDVATELYRDCFMHAAETGQQQRVQTFFLQQLGLMRMEEKAWRPAYDVGACRSAVRHAIGCGVLPEEAGDAFWLFLERF